MTTHVSTCARIATFGRPGRLRVALAASVAPLVLLGLALPPAPATGQTVWQGAPTDSWFDGGAWSGGVPATSVETRIDSAGPTLDGGANAATGDLFIGDGNTGSLTIDRSSLAGSGDANLGINGSGTVIVTGPGAKWTTAGNLTPGHTGTGVLHVLDGASVSSDWEFTAGFNAGSNAEILVDGAGSTLTSGTFTTIGWSGAASLMVSNGGRMDTGGAGTISVFDGGAGHGAATVTGQGSLWSVGAELSVGRGHFGTLSVLDGGAVTSGEAYLGRIAGGDGVALVSGAGSSWSNKGLLRVGNAGHGRLTVAEGGSVTVGGGSGQMLIAVGAGVTGTLVVGAQAGKAAVAPGTVSAGSVEFGAGTGSIVFNHTGTAYEFAPAISGDGTLRFLAGNTILTGNSSGFAGTTSLEGGSLVVNGRLGGATTVQSGTRIAGSGTFGSLTLASGSTIAPGNSIGTITVLGNLGFAAGTVYEVEIDASGASDRIDVTGTASLAGTVEVQPLGSGFLPGTEYTILTAAGGLGGTTFDALTSPALAFLTPSLAYSATTVTLRLQRNNVAFADLARTPNQVAAAAGLDSTGGGGGAYSAVLGLDAATLPAAFDGLSGEIHASTPAAMVMQGASLRRAVSQRMLSAFGDTPSGAMSIASLTPDAVTDPARGA